MIKLLPSMCEALELILNTIRENEINTKKKRLKNAYVDCGDDSVGDLLAVQVQGPEVGSLDAL